MTNYPFLNRDTDSVAERMSIIRLFPIGTSHQHSFFELIYVLQGTALRTTPDTNTPIRAGDFYIIPPLHIHGYTDTHNLEIFSCLFLSEYIDRTVLEPSTVSSLPSGDAQSGASLCDQIFHDSDGTVRQLIQKMEQEYASCQSGYIEMLRCCLTQILIYSHRACATRSPHSAVAQVVEYMKVHYAESVSLNSLSQLVGYTPQYLSNLFSQEVGMSIQTCLQRIRIDEACGLLSRTNKTTAEIAGAVGYQDVRHFSKIFVRYMNTSPREYRKQHKR